MDPTANLHGWHDAFEVFEGTRTVLARGFRSPSPPPAPTGNEAVVAHDLDIASFLDSLEAPCSVVQPSTWYEDGFHPRSHRLGWWSPVSVTRELVGLNDQPEARESEEEVSEEETESEDELRPSQMAMKKPVGAWGSAATGQGEGERAPSEGIPIADAPEEQEEDEEDAEDDDEYAPAAAPARPVRGVAGGQQPARNLVAPAPVIANRKSTAWSAEEDAACIRLMKEVCTLAQYAAIASTEKRFEVVATRMKREAGFERTASGVKLQWNRRLREASKFEDRGEKKRASGLTTSALGQGTKSGTRAATSLGATPSSGTKPSSSPAQSTETSSLSSVRKGKRKAITIDDDDHDDDYDNDFLSVPRLSKPSKRVRSTSVASSSAVPSTQDVSYYALSTENIISGTRSSRHKSASSTITPARPLQKKRARTIEDDEEDEAPPTAAPQPKRAKVNSPEPAPNSKAYWEKALRDRQAKLARQREEVERQRQAQQDEEEEDEDPIISTGDRAKKGRERRKHFPGGMNSFFRSPSPANSPPPAGPPSPPNSSQPAGPPSPPKPASTTKASSAATKSSPANSFFSITNPFGARMPAGMARPRIYTTTAPLTRPSLSGRTSSTTGPIPNNRPSLSGRLFGSGIHRSRPSSTTTSSSTVNHNTSATQPEHHNSQPSSGEYRRLGEPRRHNFNRRSALSPIAEQSERRINPYEDEDEGRPAATTANAIQILTDEEMARQLHEEINGPPSRSRCGRGFR
ncbi:hypothetical protein M436DRAFT_61752 [Aureobasidium namibiae CBS 147.97]|uniref:Myb-like domain-containing protein n=1 Tax=Aureobasidium namibiae CBS 147.97 TaxID=1043004 RepID=A0A074WQB1_9PEZI